ncbi:DNA polymerase III subunit delta [Catalinimonas niigatensis]|uniref:DNA polymerase III subunit delta n=1 Tax=Catalinimonas niigatensis TaxID=1397264 RepID=UPI00266524C4|nr:DNA polymerase III subunit delta [Catalinimonas niigatensis]WPP52538.1 DNA polymerase III subunit delta [Catalinimonas niigatensis]
MPHSPESVLKSLREKQFAPLYFLQGDEPYFIDQIADYIEENVLSESERGFNQMVMYGKDVDVSTILSNARRYPMMSERQVVIVREAQEIQDLNNKQGQELMEAYVKNPMPSTILVFCYKYKTFDGRKPLSKLLDKLAILVESKKMYDNQLPEWIAQYVKHKGSQIEDKAVQMLADYIGNNLERLTNEIEKVLINFRQGEEEGKITPAIVQKYIGISKEYNVFELQKALAVRDVLKANRIIQYFEANQKANPIIPIIALLFTFFSKLLLVHHSTDKSERALAGVLKINPFFAKEYKIAAVNYPLPKVISNIHHLRVADQHSKGIENISGTDAQILKELIFRLMH